jgi:hypothetical protein
MGFAAAWSVGVTLLLAAGCSEQAEGERCSSAKNGDGDCDEGLTCVLSDQLQDGSIGDRCCAPDGAPIGDARCTRKTGTGSSTGGTGSGSGGGGGTSGSGTSGSSGTPASGGSSQGEGGADTEATGGSADTGSGGLSSSGAGGV